MKILILIFGSLLFASSCKEESNSLKNTESDLITKINAVQEQVMAQGNMTEEEEKQFSWDSFWPYWQLILPFCCVFNYLR